jgi:hypothetical protein
LIAYPGELCFKAIGSIVKSGMEHATVSTDGVKTAFAFFLKDNNARFGIPFFNSLAIENSTIPPLITKKPELISDSASWIF